MVSARTAAKTLLTVLLSLAMLVVGVNKCTDRAHAQMHAELARRARQWVTVAPATLLPPVSPDTVLMVVGVAEVAIAVLLWVPVLELLGSVLLLALLVAGTASTLR